MTQHRRIAALEAQHPGAWTVLGDRHAGGPITYTVCGRQPGEPSREITAVEFARFAATHPIAILRIYERGEDATP